MSNVFIIHGAYGNPNENWQPWLKKELENIGHTVYVPEFPTPKDQTLDNWNKAFEKYLPFIDDDTRFIAHSLGPSFVLNILEKINQPVTACYFVSGFIGNINNPNFDEIIKTFVEKPFDWKMIKRNCQYFLLFHSNNDPYVPLDKAKELSEKLDSGLMIIKNGGHFNSKSGYDTFEELLEEIK